MFYDPNTAFSLPSNHIKCFFLDDRDVMWIGSSKHGVGYVNLSESPFENILLPGAPDVGCIIEDSTDGSMWLGCDGMGVARLMPDGSFRTVLSGSGIDRVISGCTGRDGTIWWGTFGNGVFCQQGMTLRRLADIVGAGAQADMPQQVRKACSLTVAVTSGSRHSVREYTAMALTACCGVSMSETRLCSPII